MRASSAARFASSTDKKSGCSFFLGAIDSSLLPASEIEYTSKREGRTQESAPGFPGASLSCHTHNLRTLGWDRFFLGG